MNRTLGRIASRLFLASAACAALLLGAAASASAGTLDQQQTSSNSNAALFATQSAGQTFTAGITGGLDQADLLIFKTGPSAEPLTVEIRNASAGTPGTSVLASASIPNSAIGTTETFVPATFAPPAAVTAGTQYALVAYTTHVTNDWGGWFFQNATNPYSRGAGFNSHEPVPPQTSWSNQGGGDDYAFRTYVTPAPTTPGPPPTTTFYPTTPTPVTPEKKTYAKFTSKKLYKPRTFFFGAHEVIVNVSWSKWGKRFAKGTGTYQVNDCIPDCADGTVTPTPSTIYLTGRERCGQIFVFSRMKVYFAGQKRTSRPFCLK
jgi:hypothetical protein